MEARHLCTILSRMALTYFRPTFHCASSPDLNFLSISTRIELETITNISNMGHESARSSGEPMPVTETERQICWIDCETPSSPWPNNTVSTKLTSWAESSDGHFSVSGIASTEGTLSPISEELLQPPKTLLKQKKSLLEPLRRFSHEVTHRFIIQHLWGPIGLSQSSQLAATLLYSENATVELVACYQERQPWVPCHYLYIRTPTWNHMRRVTAGLDLIYPSWGLTKQIVHRK